MSARQDSIARRKHIHGLAGQSSGDLLLISSNIKTDKKIAKEMRKDKSERIEIERYFSIAKRRNSMGLISQKRNDTYFLQ